MDGQTLPVSPHDLYARLGTAASPVVLDVRCSEAFGADNAVIAGAIHRPPESVPLWLGDLPSGRPIVVYCAQGHEVSQDVAAALRTAGVPAAYLEDGIAGWKERRLPTRRKSEVPVERWVTREHPKIDRIACPWLVLRFINPEAEFIYVPPSDVLKVAAERGAIPYDIKDVEFGHAGERCSFDAIIGHFGVADPALDRLATIVRGADTSRPDLAPQCEGLLAISYGLSANFPDDHDMLKHGLVIYDALYTWCRIQNKASS
jgi:rhodanese-related sulfurtransferase